MPVQVDKNAVVPSEPMIGHQMVLENGETSEAINYGEVVSLRMDSSAPTTLPDGSELGQVVTLDHADSWFTGPLYCCQEPGGVAAGESGRFVMVGIVTILTDGGVAQEDILSVAAGDNGRVDTLAGINVDATGAQVGERVVGGALTTDDGTGTGSTCKAWFDGSNLGGR